ncbi:MAG: hypothetical protein E7125_02600 [Bacteroidales bacterium]|nr:hypothetical protein [Bacteroidales bacterium]
MKKLFALAVTAIISLSALAQSSYNYYKFEDTAWNVAGRIGISYNLVNNVPEGMSRSGLGLDFCILEGQYMITKNSIVSLGILDIQLDFRYLQKGNIFESVPMGDIYRAAEDSRAKAHITDVAFSFPFGYTQRFSSRWAASLFVAPGLGLIRYHNDYIADDVHYHDNFYPIRERTGFRLDLKAIVWFEDMGLMLRYQPIGFNKQSTFSVGLAVCY